MSGLSLVLVCTAACAGLVDRQYDADLTQGVDLIMRQEYDSAGKRFAAMTVRAPRNPAARFLNVSLMAGRFYDKNDTSQLAAFYVEADTVLALTQLPCSPMCRFYHAATLGYLAVFHSNEGRWLQGAVLGYKAAAMYNDLSKDKVASGDVLGMLGSYHYWTSSILKGMFRLPFLGDRRAQGIEELSRSIGASRYLTGALVNSLIWIYYDNKQYAKALSLCESILDRYPRNRVYRKTRLAILYMMGRYNQAETLARDLLKEYEGVEEAPVNYYIIKIKLALIYFSSGKIALGNALVREVDQVQFDEYMRQRLQKHIDIMHKAVREQEKQ
ncbi:MAG: hypothetical protein A2268_09180 [Candidatus Raymondbacteria bacterium RifOxyA12_full_50_37]|uniref:Tetratricopeptide repeat protein n=1 Tax=Candidatus Raymondbacteria bacterium RIFOXYD12_FULL_49_13 TaxID=1817890 RepID=A0A1F7F928_UNCRA|nr:MAG: hypothetical protein A2248_05390 [Candidatus Raymondbacteria bacterium RIFOXYA2_FULL_49_16]OGJ88726.1 MAG: hypothetical protein A2268_09180 [Candidatus Raymondbacteria bacterium RifOxyA12_full_50_37]OGJ97717.1 MAG: hypothetical protein A2453_09750 [Candidatus Raymondbacteria bacterium RIFOXYC2_FULL_50_21]OGK01062.1 MAG: hypothetical protein A2350_01080 [Candidatus Raymondbacteria bacterium RifOxyB12_full_50_8]OGK01428.1 MAG: hypothetical protein A2487_15875 [Candidatus Raymondbacteria b